MIIKTMPLFAIFLLWSVAAMAQISSTGDGLWSQVVPQGAQTGHVEINHAVIIDDGLVVHSAGSIIVKNGGTLTNAGAGGVAFHVSDDTQFQGDTGQGTVLSDIGLWVEAGGRLELAGPEVTPWLDTTPLSGFVPFSFIGSLTGTPIGDGSYGVQRAMAYTDDRAVLSAAPVGWQVGDTLLFTTEQGASTNGTLTSVNGAEIHYTIDQQLDAYVLRAENGVIIAPKIGNLSRRFVISSADVTDANPNRRAHIHIAAGATANLNNVELKNLGPRRKLGRYPIHWHMAGDATGQGIRGSSIHQTVSEGGNRFVTLHGVQGVTLNNNIMLRSMGNGIYTETPDTFNNTISNNLTVDVQHSHPVPGRNSYEELPDVDNQLFPLVTPSAHHIWARQGNQLINNVSVGGYHLDVRTNKMPHSNGVGLLSGDYKVDTTIQGHTCLGPGGFCVWTMTAGSLARVEGLKSAYARTAGWYPIFDPAELDNSTLILNGWVQAWRAQIFINSGKATAANSHLAGLIAVHNHYRGVSYYDNITINADVAWSNTYWETQTYANDVRIGGNQFFDGKYPRLKRQSPVPQVFENTTFNGQDVSGIWVRDDVGKYFPLTGEQIGAGVKVALPQLPEAVFPGIDWSDGRYWTVTPVGGIEGIRAGKESVNLAEYELSLAQGRRGYQFGIPPGTYEIRHYAAEQGGDPISVEVVTYGEPSTPANQPPTATITTEQTVFPDTDGLDSEIITLTGLATDPDNNIDRVEWLVDDRLESTEQTAVLTRNPGDYAITFRVVDSYNETAEDYLTITVLPPVELVDKNDVLELVDEYAPNNQQLREAIEEL